MPPSREKVIKAAERLVARGKVEAAIREYRKVLADNPGDTNTLNRVGDLYARIDRIDEAVSLFGRIAEHYTEDGFFVKAIAIYKKIIKLDPTRLEIYEELAGLYHRQGLVNEARTQYQVLVDYFQKHQDLESALGICGRMQELEPDNPSHRAKKADLLHQQGRIDEAMAEYRAIADQMVVEGEVDNATRVYEKALDLNAENIGFITDAVLKLREGGHTSAAASLLAAAVKRNPKAEQVARLVGAAEEEGTGAGVAEPEPPRVAAEPEPPRAPAEAAAPVEEAPPPAAEEPEAPAEEEVSTAALEPEAVTPPPAEEAPAPAPPAVPVQEAAPEAAAEVPEFDLDLDEEAFDFDLEDEDMPSSLVQPPPDMVDQPHRSPSELGLPGTPPPSAAAEAPAAEATAAEPEVAELADAEVAEAAARAIAEEGLGAASEVGESPAADEATGTGEELELTFSELEVDLEAPAEARGGAAEAETAEVEAAEPTAPAAEAPEAEIPAMEAPEGAGALPLDIDLLHRTAEGLQPQHQPSEDDLVAEAEVLAKYGLREKAFERLREAFRLDPRHLGGYALQISLYLEDERHERVLVLATEMAAIASEEGQPYPWEQVRKRLERTGYQVEGDRVVAVPGAPAPAAEVTEADAEVVGEEAPGAEEEALAPAVEEVAWETVDEPAVEEPPAEAEAVEAAAGEEEVAAEEPAVEAPAAEEPPKEPAAKTKRAARDVEASLAELASSLLDHTVTPRQREAEAAPAAEAPATPEAIPAQPPAQAPEKAAEAAAGATLEAGPGAAAPEAAPAARGSMDMTEELLKTAPELAGENLEMVEAPEPGHHEAPPAATPPQAAPTAESADRLEESGTSWLDEVSTGEPEGDAGGLFDDEEGFFNLAAELEKDLRDEELFKGEGLFAHPNEQSLEEIVEGFKRGVAEHLSSEDFETHFNLGIAYREMGLLDEAIGEFQLAAKDPDRLVDCCSMLGMCFLEKGLPELALKWYRRGLEHPGVSEEDSLGLLYELGNAYLAMGEQQTAYKTFVDIYGINTNYRDVVAKLEELAPHPK